jgi:hypothetical protein
MSPPLYRLSYPAVPEDPPKQCAFIRFFCRNASPFTKTGRKGCRTITYPSRISIALSLSPIPAEPRAGESDDDGRTGEFRIMFLRLEGPAPPGPSSSRPRPTPVCRVGTGRRRSGLQDIFSSPSSSRSLSRSSSSHHPRPHLRPDPCRRTSGQTSRRSGSSKCKRVSGATKCGDEVWGRSVGRKACGLFVGHVHALYTPPGGTGSARSVFASLDGRHLSALSAQAGGGRPS